MTRYPKMMAEPGLFILSSMMGSLFNAACLLVKNYRRNSPVGKGEIINPIFDEKFEKIFRASGGCFMG